MRNRAEPFPLIPIRRVARAHSAKRRLPDQGGNGVSSTRTEAERNDSRSESAMPVFEKRRIGRTSVEVTELGLGCATLGGSRIAVSRQQAEAIVAAAWAA